MLRSPRESNITKKKARTASTAASARLYVLKVWLGRADDENFDEISRTIEIAGHHTLEDLHDVIFQAFDREDEHLWMFYFTRRNSRVVARRYIHPRLEVGAYEGGYADETRIDSLGLRARSRFHYVFDLGDEWHHEIIVEKTGKLEGPKGRPRMVARVGESPPQYPGRGGPVKKAEGRGKTRWRASVDRATPALRSARPFSLFPSAPLR